MMSDMLTILELTDYKTLSIESREYLIRSKDISFIERLNCSLKYALEKLNDYDS